MKRINYGQIFFYCTIVVSAICVFLGTYGVNILNPTYMDVCHTAGDVQQHYYGWKAFRNSAWMFPWGMFNSITYPDTASIIFTDSIPLLAILGKIISPILPLDFQYFGLWTIFCYILQTAIIARITKYYTKNSSISVLTGILSLFLPILLHRTFIHEALSGQWIILFAIESMLLIRQYNNKYIYGRTLVLAVLASTVHVYYLLFCGMIMIGICMEELLIFKDWKKAIFLMMEYLLISALCIALLGGFSVGFSTSDTDMFGMFGANLNTFINPLGTSSILPDLNIYGWGQGDGTAYLGLGCIFLVICTIVCFVIKNRTWTKLLSNNKGQIISIITVVFIASAFAIFPNMTINSHRIIQFHLPDWLINICGNFRGNGRATWVVTYFFLLLCVITIDKMLPSKVTILILICSLCIQIYDLHDYLNEKYDWCNDPPQEEESFSGSELMYRLGEDPTITNVVIYTSFLDEGKYQIMMDLSAWAVEHNKTVNRFYLARDDDIRFRQRVANSLENITDSNLYIFQSTDVDECEKYQLYYSVIGDYIIARSIPLE